jgi:alkylhydroperoxidase family enzyme
MSTLTSEAPLRELEQRIGFIPNLAAAIAESPVAVASFVAQQGTLRQTRLTPLEREVVGITVSAENECEYSLQELTLSLLRERGHVQPHDDALEVIAQIAYTTLANYVANVKRPPIDAAFSPV